MEKLSRWCRRFSALLTIALAGCAGLPAGMEAPAVTIADFGISGGSLFEQQFNLKLRIQNPNSEELRIDGVAFSLDINDAPFASGVGNQAVTVARFGTAFMPVEAFSSLGGVIKQISGFLQGDRRALRYRIKGTLSLAGGLRIPFDRSGEFDFAALAPK
jgi:LEA14-like dessication related protein